MEQLIRELYDPSNQGSSDRINEIQRQIQRLQREKAAWQLGLDLLQHDEATVRFYGALTLTIKINADWDHDGMGKDEQMRQYLLEALVGQYLRLVNLGDTNFVLQKLCSTLVTLFAKTDSGWESPLKHVLTCLLAGHHVPESQSPEMEQLLEAAQTCSDAQLKGVLMIAVIMAEDLASHSSSSADEGQLTTRVAAHCLDAWQLLKFCIARSTSDQTRNDHDWEASHASKPILSGIRFPELLSMAMQATPYWASMIKHAVSSLSSVEIQRTEEIAKESLAACVGCLQDDSFTGPVLQMLMALQQSCPKLLRDAIPNYPASLVKLPKMTCLVESLTRGDFGTDGILYVDLLEAIMAQVDTTTPDFLHSGRYYEAIQTLQRLLRCEGPAVVEDVVCQIVLEKISEIVEGYTDWDQHDPADEAAIKTLAADACDACLLKVKLPWEQMSSDTQDWDGDERAKFQDFRYDVQDFFQSAFAVLGNGLLEAIVKTILSQGDSPDWSTFEAGTFILTAFSDTMSSDPDTYDGLITTVLRSPAWNLLLQCVGGTIPDRARQTGIRFIANNVVYLQRHPDSLVLVLNFLFSSLHLQASASAASRAIYSLCDSHRRTLTEGLPQFMESLAALGDLGEAERHRLHAAVAAIIQALPSDEAKIQPLSQLLGLVGSGLDVTNNLPGADTDEGDPLLESCIDTMQTLASIGKGLRSPDDVPVDLEATDVEHYSTTFWYDGPGAPIQRQVLGIYQACVQKVQRQADNVFMEACCEFIRSGFTEQHPSPFKFPDAVGLELVGPLVSLENPSIDTTMACASSFLASCSARNIEACLGGLLYPVTSDQRRTLSAFGETGQLAINGGNFPSASLDFLARLMTKWGRVWFSMHDAQITAGTAFETALVVMADADTLPRRSAAAFFAAFADFSSTMGTMDVEAANTTRCIASILETFGPRILSLVLYLLGGECARSEIEGITEALKRFVQKHLMLTKTVLREAVKQESGVMSERALKATTLEQRTRFLAQVEALRGGRKTNDIVKDFWVACRGSGFGYIG